MRRVLALVVGAAALLLALTPPASAATPNGAWTDPSPSASYENTPLAYLTQGQTLGGFAEFDQGIDGVSFTLLTDDDTEKCSAKEGVEDQHAAGGGTRIDFTFEATFPCNRRYKVRAVVTPVQRPLRSDSPLTLDLWVAVALPPPPISELTASTLSGDERGVQLSWESVNDTPDFAGYAIWRLVGDGEWKYLNDAGPKATSYTDHAVPRQGGTVRYRVFGIRPGPDPGQKIVATSSPTAKATVAEYVPPTTTTAEGAPPSSSIQVTGGEGPRVVTRTIGRTPRTTIDTGYEGTLPFQQPQPTDAAPPPAGNAIATLSDEGDDSTQRQTMLLVAGGTTTLSWALVLRYLTKRATSF